MREFTNTGAIARLSHWFSLGFSGVAVLAFLILAPSHPEASVILAAVLLLFSAALGVKSSQTVSTAKQAADATMLNLAVAFVVFAGSREVHLEFFFLLPMLFSFVVFRGRGERYHFLFFLALPTFLLITLGAASGKHPVLWNRTIWVDPEFELYLVQFAAMFICAAVLLVYRHNAITQQMLLEARASAAVKAEQTKSRYLASVAHEIRTPISSILGFSEMLEKQESDTTRRQMASLIVNVSTNLLEVVNDLLDGETLELGRMVVRSEPTPLLRVVEAACNTMRLHAHKSQVDFFLNFDCDLPETILSDRVRLRQVLINLISNAVKFSTSGHDRPVGICRLRVMKEGENTILFEVADSGIGMTPEQVERVFDPFKQAHEGIRDTFGGTGLGLSIVKTIVQDMGGDIQIESEIGKGTVARVRLPLVAVDSPELVTKHEAKNCVLYSDTPYLGDLAARYLKARGHSVTWCETQQKLLSESVPVGSIVVLMDLSNRFVRRLAKQISVQRPDLRVVGIASDPEQMTAVGVHNVVAATPLVPSELWHAINGPVGELLQSNYEEFDYLEVPPRVLVVEDSEIYRLLMIKQLSRLGASVTAVTTIREAKEILRSKPVNLVLTDCHLPDGKGVDLLEPVQAAALRTGKAPLMLAMSGAFDLETKARAEEAGILGYEQKPIPLEKLQGYFAHVIAQMAVPTDQD